MSENGSSALVDPARETGQVFKETFDVAFQYMHPDDAVSIAEEAARNFLDIIDASRPLESLSSVDFRASNVDEIADAVMKKLPRKDPYEYIDVSTKEDIVPKYHRVPRTQG